MILFEREILSELMVGRTHYLDVGDHKQISVYYPSDCEALMKTPDAKIIRGQMTIKDVGYNISWHDGARDYYSIAEHMGAFLYIDADGKSAGTITKIAPGNPEFF